MSNQTAVSDLPHYTGEEWLEGLEWGVSPANVVEYYGLDADMVDLDIWNIAKEECAQAVANGCVVDLTSLYDALKRVRDSL